MTCQGRRRDELHDARLRLQLFSFVMRIAIGCPAGANQSINFEDLVK